MIIALATPRVASSVDEALEKIRQCLADASAQGAAIVCFPEAYLPGLRGLDFEVPPFDKATVEVAKVAAALTQAGKLTTVAGGGDTLAALAHAGVLDQFSYVSTAGGAFLEWLEGKPLPGVEALSAR